MILGVIPVIPVIPGNRDTDNILYYGSDGLVSRRCRKWKTTERYERYKKGTTNRDQQLKDLETLRYLSIYIYSASPPRGDYVQVILGIL